MIAIRRPLGGKDVLALILAFFACVTSVNLLFVYLAVTTFSGLETDDAYRKGLRYNETIAAAEAQRGLGWTARLDHELATGSRLQLSVTFAARDGAPIEDLSVTAALRRPTHEGHDQSLTLQDQGGGRHDGEIVLPLLGQWSISLHAASQSGETFVAEQRLWLN